MNAIDYVLGLDLGSASLGWAVIEVADGGPCGLIRAGVRVFDPGVDGNIEQGQDESRNKARREARLQRRQLRRRMARQRDLFELLQTSGLLPPAPAVLNGDRSAQRHRILNQLDKKLWISWKDRIQADPAVVAGEHILPYYLRSRGLVEPLEPYALGRVLYHLAQRRGFKSNRKAQPKSDEDEGQVKAGISELRLAIQDSGAQTLGEYFSRIDPNVVKLRRRWTDREMFLHEFEKLWTKQAEYKPELLNGDLKQKIHTLLFFQRPLQDNDHLVGQCELEKGEKRAPWACLAAQRFRLLQRANDLEIEEASGHIRPLLSEERGKLIAALEEGDQTFATLRKILGIKGKEARFNLERGGEKKLPGDRISPKLRKALGEKWDYLDPAERDQLIELWRKSEDDEELSRNLQQHFACTPEEAHAVCKEKPEPAYCAFSRKALNNLLPLLESGVRLNAAIKLAYPERGNGAIYDLLPPLSDLRNPAINRALSELRKVVNAIIREYGKPAAIRVELARDLKRSREDRKAIWKENREREKAREAAQAILNEAGIPKPAREDIEKYMLAEECNWECPYTGKKINRHSLFTSPEFEVEHILPLSRFPDNSFQNKTLCHRDANRDKLNRTPYEAFHGDEERWAQILQRVKKFGNPVKLRRFQMTPEETTEENLLNDFTARQLQDTRYASKLAAQYLAKLYGGRDEDGQRRIFASSGQVTATLRQVWQMNNLLGVKGEKNREDHRHHAVDAITIGLTSESAIKQMSDTAARNRTMEAGKPFRPFRQMQQPWPDFISSLRPHIESINVSHRPHHKLSGPLHKETLYGKPYSLNGKQYVNVRKSLAAITANEVNSIVDDAVREAVQAKIQELGGDVKKLNALPQDQLPTLKTRKGGAIPIRRVRIRTAMQPRTIGKDMRERYVQPGNNHHIELFAEMDANGKEKKWEGIVVSLLDAMERKRSGEPVVARNYSGEENCQFKFSLMNGDLVEMEDGGKRLLFAVRMMSEYGTGTVVVGFVRANDARVLKDMDKNDFKKIVPETMRKLGCRKVTVDLLGNLHPASD